MSKRPRNRRRYSQREAAAKPLLGFGWAGWVLTVIALALLWSVITGYDLRYRLQELILHTLGVDALMRFTIELGNTAVLTGTWPPGQHFGPMTMCIILLGLQVHPRRVGCARLATLFLLGIAGPSASMWLNVYTNRLFSSGFSMWMFGVGWLEWCLVVVGVLWFVARSWRLALIVGAILFVPVLNYFVLMLGDSGRLPEWAGAAAAGVDRHLGLAMHAALLATMLTWGIRERLRVLPSYACQSCGYDLRSLGSSICPECGSSAPADPAPAVDSN